ncbi:MAG: FAD/NAD(P)-binding oxidoreductase [Anaerolineaceae bacterium]|jgi:glycerol-3-phosphate dehydrogenase|nr:MAG: FAD/NAD(P)-binding oxidoreductase [Anaerolineaceae bacterium]
MNENRNYDIIIIGGGVIGCMLARFLSRYTLKILLIEKESDIGSGTSAANTAIVHPGYDAIPGSLKAKFNVAANPMWDQLAAELQFAFQRHGDYVVAIGEDELSRLEVLLQRGKQNGVPGMQFVSADVMRSREPNINPAVSGAIWATSGGICDPFGVTIAAAENAVTNGAIILRNTAFEDFIWSGKRIIGVKTSRGTFTCRWVVNAAGLFSDTVMHKAGVRPDFKITPRKGEYFVLDRTDFTVNNVLFPVPSAISKGILVTTTTHGNTIIGPNAQNIEDKENKENTKDGMNEVFEGAKKLVPAVNPRHIIAIFAGLRAAGNAPCTTAGVDYKHDFIVEIPKEIQGFINLGGIESPGLTAAPAIALYVVELLKDTGEKLPEKKDWDPIRPARPQFRHLTHAQREVLIKKDARYGRVVCRCENVTEGEIVAEIHSPVPALTYDAIKRRTWLGTGRCQGGFDMPRVTEILARELGISQLEISKKNGGSKFLCRPTKEDGGAQ